RHTRFSRDWSSDVCSSDLWNKVSNMAFTVSVLAALAVFFPVRFGWLALEGPVAFVSDLLAVIGVGVIAGLMAFGFFGPRVGRIEIGRAACRERREVVVRLV